MNLYDLSPNAIPIVLKDAIDNNKGAVWDLIRKVPYFYYDNNLKPNWLYDPNFSNSTIYFLNPLNNKVMELRYSYDEWKMPCNFTDNKMTECIVLINSIENDCLAALLPYSGMGEEDYDDLPF